MDSELHPEKKWCLMLLSLIALFWGIGSLTLSFLGSWASYMNWDITSYIAQGPYPRIGSIGEWFSIIGGCSGFMGLIVIFVLLVYCMVKKIRGLNALLICLSFLMSFCAFFLPFTTHARLGNSPAKIYPFHLRNIGHTLEIYTKEHNGQLPASDSWCDAVLSFVPSFPRSYFAIDPKDKDMSVFAMNSNVSESKLSELPKNTVLLFETPLAKNPAGGPELMSINNHPVKGCYVLFADMHVEFVRAEDFNNLRWKP
ncbi:MAG: hypothetical protein ABSB25_06565 [Sedimentisphaerales bacterium]